MTGKNKNDSRSKLKYPCGLCGEECKTNTIQCAKCEKWYHQQCTEVPPAIMAHLGKVKGLFWSCDACLGTPIKDSSALSVLEQKVEIITEQITSLSKTMNSLNPPTTMHKHQDQQTSYEKISKGFWTPWKHCQEYIRKKKRWYSKIENNCSRYRSYRPKSQQYNPYGQILWREK